MSEQPTFMGLPIIIDDTLQEDEWYLKASPVFSWDDNVKRFRQRGRFISLERVAELRDKYIEGEADNNRQMVEQLFDRSMTIGEFEDQVRDALKRVYSVQYMIARGGRFQMTQRDWGALGQMLREQYQFLRNNLLRDIVNGRYTIDQMDLVLRRLNLYIQNSSAQAFERANLEKWRGVQKWLMWTRNHLKDSCADCVRLEGQVHTADEWLSSGYWPRRGGGTLACLGIHCGCSVVEVDATESSGGF